MAKKNNTVQAFGQLMRDLENKVYSPVYLLHGEEPYYIDELISYMEEHILEEEFKAFNQTVVYGRDVTAREVADLCRRFSMMGNYQLVIVKEAQDLMANNRKLDDLIPYFDNLQESTILVLGFKYKKIDKRKAFYKKLKGLKKAVVFETEKLYDNQVPNWIETYVKNKGYTIDPKSTRLLTDHVGNDLSRLVNEINKLFITSHQTKTITPEIIETNIGISKDFNIFELTNALSRRDILKAQRIVQYFAANPKENPLQMITVMLYNYFVKVFLYHRYKNQGNDYQIATSLGVNAFFVKDYAVAANNYSPGVIRQIITEIRYLDLKSKGYGSTNGNDYGPLSEFVFKCIHRVFPEHEEPERLSTIAG